MPKGAEFAIEQRLIDFTAKPHDPQLLCRWTFLVRHSAAHFFPVEPVNGYLSHKWSKVVETVRLTVVLVLTVCAMAGPVAAQNVTGYESMSNPYLLLLREPAVIDDLQLTPAQQSALRELNEEIDGPLLALRSWPSDQAGEKMAQLVEQSERRLEVVFSDTQRRRLSQIMLRLRGIKLVLAPQVVDQLRLSEEQRDGIRVTLDETAAQLDAMKERLAKGEPRERIETEATQIRQKEQSLILSALDAQQRQRLLGLVGPTFDPSRLRRVSFRAPEFQQSSEWINSTPLRLENLRGRVVILHFWAFG